MVVSVFKDLLERRVPQILGFYLGGAWVTIEFVSFLVDRFLLSPHLIELTLVVLGSLIPSVALLAFFHGKPGRNAWATVEKIGIPLNLALAALLVTFVFSGKQLGAATTRLVLENEDGRSIERVVAKSEFRKRLLIFNFDNETGDSTLDWLQLGIALGLLLDLDQDSYLSFGDIKQLLEETRRAGYPEGVGMPLTLQASLAAKLQQDHFVSGFFEEDDGQLAITTSLYETKRQKLIAQHKVVGAGALDLIDQISVNIRRGLEIPERHIEESRDLRVADVLTESPEAFELQITGFHSILVAGDWVSAKRFLERAVIQDSSSAFAQFQLSAVYLVFNQKEEADRAARLAMAHVYRLPERWQYDLKYYYYNAIAPDAEKRDAVAKLSVELFPEYIDAHARMAWEYQRRRQFEEALAEYRRILEIDPARHEFLKAIAGVYRVQGDFARALEVSQEYIAAVPNDASGFLAIANLYCDLGEHKRGKSYFERALVIDPDNVRTINDLATVTFNLGDFEEAARQHHAALAAARTPQERAAAHARLSYHYDARGQLARAIEHKEREWAERAMFDPPAVLSESKLMALGLYARAGREDVAFDILRTAEDELVPPFDAVIPFGYLNVYLELGDPDKAEENLSVVAAWTEEREEGRLRDDLLYARGRIFELRGEFEKAVESYAQALTLAPTDITRERAIGRSYRELGQLSQAETHLKANLRVTPYNPLTHYEIALVYEAMGKREAAIRHLEQALAVWVNADPELQAATRAREKLAELQPT